MCLCSHGRAATVTICLTCWHTTLASVATHATTAETMASSGECATLLPDTPVLAARGNVPAWRAIGNHA
jgi:hypothetical protein